MIVGIITVVISIARCFTYTREHSAVYEIKTNAYTDKHYILHTSTFTHKHTLVFPGLPFASFIFCICLLSVFIEQTQTRIALYIVYFTERERTRSRTRKL